MKSDAKTVEAYLKEVPEERRQTLIRLRSLCRKALDGYEEQMEYGMPSYKRAGQVEVAFASQKKSINLYILNQQAMAKNRERLQGLSIGKGCIRYGDPAKMDFALIADLLADTAASAAGPC